MNLLCSPLPSDAYKKHVRELDYHAIYTSVSSCRLQAITLQFNAPSPWNLPDMTSIFVDKLVTQVSQFNHDLLYFKIPIDSAESISGRHTILYLTQEYRNAAIPYTYS